MAEGPDLKSAQYRFESDGGDMPKKKIVNAPIVEYKPGEEKLVMFGWCSTGHHSGCSIEFVGHKCSCQCHAKGGESNDSSGEV